MGRKGGVILSHCEAHVFGELIIEPNQYGWTPYNGKVTLIRSSESTENPNLDCHISQWSKLAIRGVEVFIVPGHHETLFLEPEVAILSAKLNEILRVSREKKIIAVDV